MGSNLKAEQLNDCVFLIMSKLSNVNKKEAPSFLCGFCVSIYKTKARRSFEVFLSLARNLLEVSLF